MSSLKNLVILVVGDLNTDAVVLCWTASNVENWLRLRGIKQVFEINDSVTHVVCSRAAHAANVPEVQFVKSIRGWNKEGTKRGVPRLVTYDWLEDTLNDNKPMKHFWAYDPSKPRDIEAMLDGRRKATKQPRAAKGLELGAEEASEAVGISEELVQGGGAKDSSSSKSASEEKAKVAEKKTTVSQARIEYLDISKDNKPLGAELHISNSTANGFPKSTPSDKPIDAQKQAKKVISPEEKVIPKVDDRPWEVKVQARVFQDKEKFPYHVELTRKKDGLRWVLAVFESTSAAAPKAYRFRALQYSAKGHIILKELRDPVLSLHAALKCFTGFFHARTGYAWDERLLRAQAEQPRWQYRPPAAGKPTGGVPREYTPGHPHCVKNLIPVVIGWGIVRNSRIRQERSLSKGPQRGRKNDKNIQWEMLTEKQGRPQNKRKGEDSLDSDREAKVLRSVPPT